MRITVLGAFLLGLALVVDANLAGRSRTDDAVESYRKALREQFMEEDLLMMQVGPKAPAGADLLAVLHGKVIESRTLWEARLRRELGNVFAATDHWQLATNFALAFVGCSAVWWALYANFLPGSLANRTLKFSVAGALFLGTLWTCPVIAVDLSNGVPPDRSMWEMNWILATILGAVCGAVVGVRSGMFMNIWRKRKGVRNLCLM
jgi:hypothetical protein